MAFPYHRPKSTNYLEQQLIRNGAVALKTDWDISPLEVDCMYFNHVMLYVHFEADAGVNLLMCPEFAMDNIVTWYKNSAYDMGAIAAGVDTISLLQREILSYGSVDADDYFTVKIELAAGVEHFRLPCKHDGQGEYACEIYGQFSYK